ncbi:acetolactate synthase large subunit [Roseovarius sp. ZX-A-9]|uniref:acetolactate synthase large subunit n=1 Tax=Roseovarius sp. ZX-A-9 TaxID=3014783 RepID=UPI0023302E70|nr:acetolactate synthase large subunit [Roseovarius sp. ZX-A-9]
MADHARGADLLVSSLLFNGVDTCFANPGTSEMHFVAALDERPEMRCVLGLFEGVVTGAADGYGRMTDRPAATLLHTGPGLANGLANLHNARRAHTPLLNIVGDHASTHLPFDAPLTTDIEGLARPMSDWVGRVGSAASVGTDTATALTQALSGAGRVSTLVLPADAAWGSPGAVAEMPLATPAPATQVSPDAIEEAARLLRSARRGLLLLGGKALRQVPLEIAQRIAVATGAGVMCEQTNARCEQGQGRHAPPRIPYMVDAAVAALAEFDVVILIGARAPVAFFQFPDLPNMVTASGARILPLADCDSDLPATLQALSDATGAAKATLHAPTRTPLPRAEGPLDFGTLPVAIVQAMPENAILCDEAISYSHALGQVAKHAPPHDLLQLTGGAIGIGPSLAVGAAIACPDRPVLNVQADGSALYTIQALWTQSRERLNVVTVILSNRKYQSLYSELARMGHHSPGKNARAMLDLSDPNVDWTGLARGLGVKATRVATAEDLSRAIRDAFLEMGPHLIEAQMADGT